MIGSIPIRELIKFVAEFRFSSEWRWARSNHGIYPGSNSKLTTTKGYATWRQAFEYHTTTHYEIEPDPWICPPFLCPHHHLHPRSEICRIFLSNAGVASLTCNTLMVMIHVWQWLNSTPTSIARSQVNCHLEYVPHTKARCPLSGDTADAFFRENGLCRPYRREKVIRA